MLCSCTLQQSHSRHPLPDTVGSHSPRPPGNVHSLVPHLALLQVCFAVVCAHQPQLPMPGCLCAAAAQMLRYSHYYLDCLPLRNCSPLLVCVSAATGLYQVHHQAPLLHHATAAKTAAAEGRHNAVNTRNRKAMQPAGSCKEGVLLLLSEESYC